MKFLLDPIVINEKETVRIVSNEGIPEEVLPIIKVFLSNKENWKKIQKKGSSFFVNCAISTYEFESCGVLLTTCGWIKEGNPVEFDNTRVILKLTAVKSRDY